MRQLRNIARLRPFDGDTASGRALERYRRALLAAVFGGTAKAVSIVSTLITIPVVLAYLGSERFGVWMTILSFVSLLNFSDFGVGNGLMNMIAGAHGRGDRAIMRQHVSAAFVVLGSIGIAAFLTLSVMSPLIDWARLFNVHSTEALSEISPAMMVFGWCFAAGIPASIGQRVQMGLQRGARASAWQSAGAFAALVAVIASVRFGAPLPVLVFASVGTPAALQLINTLTFFAYREPDLAPQIRGVSLRSALALLSSGLLFFALQTGGAIAYASDNFILAHVLGPDAVTQYAVPARLFGIVSLASSTFLLPLWPAYAEAAARGDISWIRTTLRRSVVLTLLGTSCIAGILCLAAMPLLRIWVGPAVNPSFILLAGLAIWTTLEATGSAVAMFLNGTNVIRPQVILVVIFASVCVAGKVWAVATLGMSTMPWAAVLAYASISLTAYIILVPRLLKDERSLH